MCQNLVLFDLPFCRTLSYKPSPGDVPHSLKTLVIFLGMEIISKAGPYTAGRLTHNALSSIDSTLEQTGSFWGQVDVLFSYKELLFL